MTIKPYISLVILDKPDVTAQVVIIIQSILCAPHQSVDLPRIHANYSLTSLFILTQILANCNTFDTVCRRYFE